MRENPDAAQFQGTATGPDPLPPEHAFYALIGRVIAEWARFEHILDTLIWDLSAVEAVKGSCITGRLAGAGQRCHTIKALCTAHALSKDTLTKLGL